MQQPQHETAWQHATHPMMQQSVRRRHLLLQTKAQRQLEDGQRAAAEAGTGAQVLLVLQWQL
jgi:hypothetical protein